VIWFRLMKKTVILAYLFTPEHKHFLNCVLRGILVNQILEELKAVKLWFLCPPILQIVREF
jgi:hypothetical protein